MNIQELKYKFIDFATREAINDRPTLIKRINELFSEFEQSNKSEESQIKENKQVLTNDFLLKLIEGMKKEIEALKKQVKDDRFYSEHGISELKQECIRIDKVKVIDSNLKPKQERFYYNPCDYYGKTMYEIIDRNKIININSLLNYEEIAIDICKALNSLEASK